MSEHAPAPRPAGRRYWRGLIVDKQTQFKVAVTCSSLLLIPSLVAALTFTTDIALEARRLAESGADAGEVASALGSLAVTDAGLMIVVYAICAAIQMVVSLRLTNALIGPIRRMEAQLDGMLEGNYDIIPPPRQNDYLKSFGDKMNRLAERGQGKKH